jgi:hypothetical protein
MPYTLFDPSKPDAATQNGTQIMQAIQLNMKALRDMVAAGTLVYWNATMSGGTADKPTQILHSKGDEYIKEVIVWGTTGGATDNPSTITYSYSDSRTYKRAYTYR